MTHFGKLADSNQSEDATQLKLAERVKIGKRPSGKRSSE